MGSIYFDKRFKSQVLMQDSNLNAGEEKFTNEYLCETPLHCFLSLLQQGLRESSGLGTFGYFESYDNKEKYA